MSHRLGLNRSSGNLPRSTLGRAYPHSQRSAGTCQDVGHLPPGPARVRLGRLPSLPHPSQGLHLARGSAKPKLGPSMAPRPQARPLGQTLRVQGGLRLFNPSGPIRPLTALSRHMRPTVSAHASPAGTLPGFALEHGPPPAPPRQAHFHSKIRNTETQNTPEQCSGSGPANSLCDREYHSLLSLREGLKDG